MGEAKSHAVTVSMKRDLSMGAASLPRDPTPDRRTLSASERANRAAATDRVFRAGFASPGCGRCPGCRGGRANWCTGWWPTVAHIGRCTHRSVGRSCIAWRKRPIRSRLGGSSAPGRTCTAPPSMRHMIPSVVPSHSALEANLTTTNSNRRRRCPMKPDPFTVADRPKMLGIQQPTMVYSGACLLAACALVPVSDVSGTVGCGGGSAGRGPPSGRHDELKNAPEEQ